MNRVSPNFLRVLPQEFWVLTKGAINSKRHHVLPAVLGRSPALSHYTVRMSSLSTSRTFNIRTVDVRTDSVTRIGAAMHRAMAGTEFEKGPLGEDLRVKELQKMAADMFGMEAALLVPSGTMSNLIAVMVHCMERGDEMIVGDLSHMRIYEQGGSAQLAGVHSMPVTTLLDGTFDLDQLVSNIRHDYPKPFYPRSRLICLENTHNIMGGRVLPPSFLQEVRAITDRHGLAVHMDGARLMNAAVALGVSPRTILQHVDSVSVSLCKGLGAPVGSLLCGSQDFISRAIRCRKALGGGMRQAGILAAAGKLALEDMVLRLEEDHRNAKTFAKALWECDSSLFHVDMDSVETNIVCFRLCDPSLSPSEFCDHMAQIWTGEEVALQQGVRVLMLPFFGGIVRAVWHVGVNAEDTQMAIKKLQFVARQYSNNKQNNRLQ